MVDASPDFERQSDAADAAKDADVRQTAQVADELALAWQEKWQAAQQRAGPNLCRPDNSIARRAEIASITPRAARGSAYSSLAASTASR